MTAIAPGPAAVRTRAAAAGRVTESVVNCWSRRELLFACRSGDRPAFQVLKCGDFHRTARRGFSICLRPGGLAQLQPVAQPPELFKKISRPERPTQDFANRWNLPERRCADPSGLQEPLRDIPGPRSPRQRMCQPSGPESQVPIGHQLKSWTISLPAGITARAVIKLERKPRRSGESTVVEPAAGYRRHSVRSIHSDCGARIVQLPQKPTQEKSGCFARSDFDSSWSPSNADLSITIGSID